MDDSLINPSTPPSGEGCVECLEAGGWWFHLRRCAACGHIGCCDSSPGQHASNHARLSGHEVIQSFEPGEEWFWDFTAQDFCDGAVLVAPDHHPLEQPTPGPSGRVPADWQSHLH